METIWLDSALDIQLRCQGSNPWAFAFDAVATLSNSQIAIVIEGTCLQTRQMVASGSSDFRSWLRLLKNYIRGSVTQQ